MNTYFFDRNSMRRGIYVANADDKFAWQTLLKLALAQEGSIIPMSKKEFDALKKSMICIAAVKDKND